MRTFKRVLLNTLLANITTQMVWFGFTFWAYLESRSVLVTSILGGSYMLLLAVTSVPFGTLIDRVRKKTVMTGATICTAAAFAVGALLYWLVPSEVLLDLGRPFFWVFLLVLLAGALVESVRNLALATCVTMLVPATDRPKANGMVGMVQGIGFALNSVVSGLAVGFLGMGVILAAGVLIVAATALHLRTIEINEPVIQHAEGAPAKVDFVQAFRMTREIPGLMALVIFSTFNNLLGGIYMALLDPYGLELMPVQAWGILWGVCSIGFVLGGAIISRTGLGSNPVRTLLLANIVMWVVGMVMPIRESIPLLAVGCFIYMGLVTFAEASEQTVLQKVVPFARQGRVFGFAMAIELAAAPLSTLAIGPIAEFWLIPFMNSDAGRAQLGWLLGSGSTRGMALAFLLAGVIGLIVTGLALTSKPYRVLSGTYRDSVVNDSLTDEGAQDAPPAGVDDAPDSAAGLTAPGLDELGTPRPIEGEDDRPDAEPVE